MLKLSWAIALSITMAFPSLALGDCQKALLEPAKIETSIKDGLSSYFEKVSERTTRRLAARIAKKAAKNKLTEADLIKAARRFHRKLSAGYFSKFKSLSPRQTETQLKLSGEFQRDLRKILEQEGVSVAPISLKLWAARKHAVSWSAFGALHGSVAYLVYQLTGEILFVPFLSSSDAFLPFYLPNLYQSTYTSHDVTQSRLHYFDRLFTTLLTSYYSAMMAYALLSPIVSQIDMESAAPVTQVEATADDTVATALNISGLERDVNDLVRRADDYIAAQAAEEPAAK